MSVRDEFPRLAWMAVWDAVDGAEVRAAFEEIERLRRWKAEAITVMDEWERTWDAVGRPGRPGQSKSRAVREHVQALEAQLGRVAP